MKIEVAKPDLENALNAVRVALGSETDLSSHYLFRVKDGKVQVNTYGMRVFAGAPLVCTLSEAKEGDAFTVEAWRLDQWLKGVAEGVLTLAYEGTGEVTAKSKAGRVATRLRSLDPAKWPHNDAMLLLAKDVGTSPTSVLVEAISITRHFVSKDDTNKPEMCVIEVLDGRLMATDRRAFIVATVPSLPTLNLRLLGKDIPALLKFLTAKDASEVTIKTAERPVSSGGGANATFWRPDGTYFGMTRPSVDKFPVISPDYTAEHPFSLSVDVEEFKSALAVLEAGAPKQYETVTFKYAPNEGQEGTVYLVMPCEAGGTDEYPLTLARVKEYEVRVEDKLDAAGNPVLNTKNLPVKTTRREKEAARGSKWTREFSLNQRYILSIADVFRLDTITFNGLDRGKGGILDVFHAPSGATVPANADPAAKDGAKAPSASASNEYYMALVWKT